jgi:murein DD-endopeptidase MepM/ murein hydrolase activator NlpD
MTAWLALCASIAGMFRRPAKPEPVAPPPPAFTSGPSEHPREPAIHVAPRAIVVALLIGGVLGSALLIERGDALPTSTVRYNSSAPAASFSGALFEVDAEPLLAPRFEQDPELGERLDKRPEFIWPVKKGWITDLYDGEHPGVDVGFEDSPPVLAARDGVVAFVGGEICCGKGLFVVIWHDDGWSTVYGHLDSFKVEAGDEVRQGDEIGIGGNTGNSTGPHVHLELHQNGLTVDPMLYFPEGIEIRLEPDATGTPTVTETPGPEETPEEPARPRDPARPAPTRVPPRATVPPPPPPSPTPPPPPTLVPTAVGAP